MSSENISADNFQQRMRKALTNSFYVIFVQLYL